MTTQNKIWAAAGVAVVVIIVVFLSWFFIRDTDEVEQEPTVDSAGTPEAEEAELEEPTESPSPTTESPPPSPSPTEDDEDESEEDDEEVPEGATDPADIPEHGIEMPEDGSDDPTQDQSQIHLNREAEREWFPVLEAFTQLQSWEEGRDQDEWEQAISQFSTPEMADRISTIDVENLLDETYEILDYWILDDYSHDYGRVFVYVEYEHDVYIYVIHESDDEWAIENFLPDEQYGQDIEYVEPEDLGL